MDADGTVENAEQLLTFSEDEVSVVDETSSKAMIIVKEQKDLQGRKSITEELQEQSINWEEINFTQKSILMESLSSSINDTSDVILTVDGRYFRCHKIVIASYSEYLESELTTNQSFSINMDETIISADILKLILNWMYKTEDTAHQVITQQNLIKLTAVAKQLKITSLQTQCQYLIHNVTAQQAIYLLSHLDLKSVGGTEQSILDKVFENPIEVLMSETFMKLAVDWVLCILSSDKLGIEDEYDVLKSSVAWLTYRWEERQNQTVSILNTVRFALMSKLQLMQAYRDYDPITKIPAVKKMIDEALEYQVVFLKYHNNPDSLAGFLKEHDITVVEPRCRSACHCAKLTYQDIIDDFTKTFSGSLS